MQERTNILTVKDMLPEDTDPAVHLAVKDAVTYDKYRSTLREAIQYLADHGALGKRRGAAHVVDETAQPEPSP